MGERAVNLINKHDISRRLAKTVLHFQDLYLSKETGPEGLLCQVWLPEADDHGRIQLKTKGLPFCVAGTGDLLALFRCISCRFAFPIDDPAHLGAPGRVFTAGKPELACNVQHYPNGAYLRRAEAEQCQVQSSMLLPVFLPQPSTITANGQGSGGNSLHGSEGNSGDSGGGGSCNTNSTTVAVLEVVQTSDDMQFSVMAGIISEVLSRCELSTSSPEEVHRKLPTMQSNLVLPNKTGVLTPYQPYKDSSGGGSISVQGKQSPMKQAMGQLQSQAQQQLELEQAAVVATQAQGQKQEQEQQQQMASPSGSEDISMGEADSECLGDGDQLDQGASGPLTTAGAGLGPSGGVAAGALGSSDLPESKSGRSSFDKRRGRGSGNPGKPGTKLQLKDLQSQFGVGLKEAAARLGICPTTLKRACRRHGIQRWPRRALQKVNQALDEMERRQREDFNVLVVGPSAAAAAGAGAMLGVPGAGTGGSGNIPLIPPSGGGVVAPHMGDMGGDTRWTTLASFIPAFQRMPSPNGGFMLAGGGNGGMSGKLSAGGGGGGSLNMAGSWPPATAGFPAPWLGPGALPTAAGAAGGGRQTQQQQQQQVKREVGVEPAASDSSLPSGMVAMGGGGRPLNQEQHRPGNRPAFATTASTISDVAFAGQQGGAAAPTAAQMNAYAQHMQRIQQQQQQQMAGMMQQEQQRWAAAAAAAGGTNPNPHTNPTNNNIVPSFLRPGAGGPAPNLGRTSAPPRSSLYSLDSKPGDPVLKFPPGFDLPTGTASEGGFGGLSQLSIPSMGMGMSFPGGALSIGGGCAGIFPQATGGGAAGGGGSAMSPGGGRDDGKGVGDDVGLLDPSILEFLLSEDHKGGAGTDSDLQRFFSNGK